MNFKLTKKSKIIFSIVAFVILATLSFTLYINITLNPKAPELSQEALTQAAIIFEEQYPVDIVKPLPYNTIPSELELNCNSAILIDASNGCVLYEKNADEVIPPASMTKLVVMYVVFQEIATGRISMDDVVPLPPESWAVNAPPNSSLMFLGESQIVTLEELLLGLAVASGNDAAVAIGCYVSGNMDAFVQRMNSEMEKLGLIHTRFVEPSGYSELNLTTAREFAAFCKIYIQRYPEALEKFHSQRSISYPQTHNLASWHLENGREHPIFQANTNKLLGVLPGCDGLKTGFIFESGYNLSLTALRDGTRFISVTMGGPGRGSVEGNKYRTEDGTKLMEWAFSTFATRQKDEIPAMAVPVLGAKKNVVTVLPVWKESLTVPAILENSTALDAANAVTYSIQLPKFVKGPISAGQEIGHVVYQLGDVELARIPLAAIHEVSKTNFLKRFIDSVASLFIG